MGKHKPNPKTYRPLLGEEVNQALFRIVEKRNALALQPLGVNEYLRKMIAHWYEQEFPGEQFPIALEPYTVGPDFVQSSTIVQSA